MEAARAQKGSHESESRPPRGTVGQSSGKAENQVEDTEQKKTKGGKNGRKQSSHKDFPWDRHAESRTKWQCPGGASAPKTKQNSFS